MERRHYRSCDPQNTKKIMHFLHESENTFTFIDDWLDRYDRVFHGFVNSDEFFTNSVDTYGDFSSPSDFSRHLSIASSFYVARKKLDKQCVQRTPTSINLYRNISAHDRLRKGCLFCPFFNASNLPFIVLNHLLVLVFLYIKKLLIWDVFWLTQFRFSADFSF